MTDSAAEAALGFPARSVAFALIACPPSAKALVATDHRPAASAWPLPTKVVPSNSVTVALASAVPVKVGVLTLVVLSVFDVPLSDVTARSGTLGVTGAAVSIVTVSTPEAALTLPARSVALATIAWTPFANGLAAMDHTPAASAWLLPTTVAPSNSVTVALASAVPVNVGVVTLVVLSVFDGPLSDPTARSGALGTTGAVVSTVTVSATEGAPALPAKSVACAVIAWTPSAKALVVTDQSPAASA